MIIYFSGTGNSRYAAELLAKQLDDELLDAGACVRAGNDAAIYSERPFVFVAPTYAWRMPRVFSEYIRSVDLRGSRIAYFILTCGGDVGGAGKYASDLCIEKGLCYHGILQVVMPDNYIFMFKIPEDREIQLILEKARSILEQGSMWIRREKPFPAKKRSAVDWLKSGIINAGFYKMCVNTRGFYSTERCIACGKCTNVCPLNNITLIDNRPTWGKDCTHCMACISRCPTQAIEYGRKTVGKKRYICPEEG